MLDFGLGLGTWASVGKAENAVVPASATENVSPDIGDKEQVGDHVALPQQGVDAIVADAKRTAMSSGLVVGCQLLLEMVQCHLLRAAGLGEVYV